jgi:hypothetical protein
VQRLPIAISEADAGRRVRSRLAWLFGERPVRTRLVYVPELRYDVPRPAVSLAPLAQRIGGLAAALPQAATRTPEVSRHFPHATPVSPQIVTTFPSVAIALPELIVDLPEAISHTAAERSIWDLDLDLRLPNAGRSQLPPQPARPPRAVLSRPELVRRPFWVFHIARRWGARDLRAVDATTGEKASAQVREALVRGLSSRAA